MKKVLSVLLALMMLASLSVSAFAADEVTAEGYKKEIVIAMADEFTEPDPMETTAETNQIIQDCTCDLLTDTNLDTMNNEGELLESW
ncbi:MAG: hypothetical protein J5949_10265, partial [Oscillospiraceae bacterium]|nr:hypothetical protein [Oscillospiraceae bacterium]